MTIKQIIRNVIKVDARNEANLVMSMAEQKDIDDLFKYYNQTKHNIVCLVVDKVKNNLVKQEKLIQNPEDHFGHYPFGSEKPE